MVAGIGMTNQRNLLGTSASIVRRNKRYIIWFFLLNFLFADLGANGFSSPTHAILDHSLYADKMLHGFDVLVFLEMLVRPEFGPLRGPTIPATIFAALFLLASLLFMPGVILGYSFDHRISRNEFFRACSHNLWRFVRLVIIYIVIAGIIAGILFGIQGGLVKAAENALDERTPFFVQLACGIVIFIVMTAIRIWFDLAQTDVVLQDQGLVRRSIATAFRQTKRNLGKLLGTYIVISLIALAILIAGVWLWHAIVPPSSVFGAFLIGEATLLLLLAMRFWQRAAAVAFSVRLLEHAGEDSLAATLPAAVSAS